MTGVSEVEIIEYLERQELDNFRASTRYIIQTFGYDTAMIIKNLIIFTSGGIAFSIIFLLVASWIHQNITIVEKRLDGISLLSIKDKNGKHHVYVSKSKSFTQALENIIGITFYLLSFKRIPIILANATRRNLIMLIVLFILLVVVLYGMLLTFKIVI